MLKAFDTYITTIEKKNYASTRVCFPDNLASFYAKGLRANTNTRDIRPTGVCTRMCSLKFRNTRTGSHYFSYLAVITCTFICNCNFSILFG